MGGPQAPHFYMGNLWGEAGKTAFLHWDPWGGAANTSYLHVNVWGGATNTLYLFTNLWGGAANTAFLHRNLYILGSSEAFCTQKHTGTCGFLPSSKQFAQQKHSNNENVVFGLLHHSHAKLLFLILLNILHIKTQRKRKRCIRPFAQLSHEMVGFSRHGALCT